MKKRRFIFRLVLVVLLLLPVLVVLLVQTPPGKALLAKGLSNALSAPEHMEVRIGTITGWIPGSVNISSLEVGDAEGVWISGKNLHCRWMIKELLDKRVRLRRLSADEIVWHRFPKIGPRAPRTKKEDAGFQLLEIRLDGLDIESLKLEKGVAGVPLDYSVHSGGVSYLLGGRLTGDLAVSGDAEGRVVLDAELAGRATDRLTVTANLDELVHPTFGLDYLAGTAEAVISSEGVKAQLGLDLMYAGQEGHLSTGLHYRDHRLDFQDIEYADADQSLLGDVALTFTNHAVGVAVDATFVDVNTNRYNLEGRARVTTVNRQWGVDLQRLDIEVWETVAFSLSGALNAREVKLNGVLKEMDFRNLPMGGCSNFTGTVNGSVSVIGPLETPAVNAEVRVGKLRSVKGALDELPPLDFRVQGGIAEGRLFADTSITNYAKGHLAAGGGMPCEFSLRPLIFKPEPALTDADVNADLDLDIFNQLAFFQNQRLRGAIQARVSYEDRRPSGYLRVLNGRYEHFDLGIVIRAFNADLEATEQGFRIVEGHASGSGDGTIRFTGGLGSGGLDINLACSNAWILNRDEIEAQVSGNLHVGGRLFRPDLSGELTIDRADILLDNIVRDPPPVLTNYDRANPQAGVTARAKPRKPPPVGLDIRLLLPDQIFVNASMIEAVLGGSLRVVDTPQGVSVRGKIEPRRGFVSFIGKKFRFTEGEIVLDGSIPTMAVLDNLTAEYSRRDVTAQLILNGPANDPRFRLESTPAMPEDEVLSQVLFNRDTSSISPWQAYQIAVAAKQLSGGLNGPGFMYQIRQAVGIDTLEWREAEAAGEASSVAAGKYLTSGLYVEVNQTLDAQAQTGFTAELEISRHFSVETYTGPQMRPGIGLNWRNDY